MILFLLVHDHRLIAQGDDWVEVVDGVLTGIVRWECLVARIVVAMFRCCVVCFDRDEADRQIT